MAIRAIQILGLVGALLGTAGGCKTLDCADGTVEQNGTCQPADFNASNAQCGVGTHLEGDKCIPDLAPTECDPSTTIPTVNDAGVTVCVGTGGGGCGATFACPTPASGKESICGQIYDFEDMTPFQAPNAVGALCAAGATEGPCALTVKAFDAATFAGMPTSAPELAHGQVYLDDCGRYRMPDITAPGSGLVALGIDDTAAANAGPPGITTPSGVGGFFAPNTALNGFEAFIVHASTACKWQASGGPGLATGYYINVFRAHKTGFEPMPGVKVTKNGADITTDFYFVADQVTHQTVDTSRMVTGANGTALVTGAGVGDGIVWTGDNSVLPPECRWGLDAGATLAGIAFVQIKRPVNASGMTCGL